MSKSNTRDSVLSRQQISEMKDLLPGCAFFYEVRLTSKDVWSAVSFCSDVFSEAGFVFHGIKSAGTSAITVKVADTDHSDFEKLETLLQQSDVHQIDGWTTIVGRRQTGKAA